MSSPLNINGLISISSIRGSSSIIFPSLTIISQSSSRSKFGLPSFLFKTPYIFDFSTRRFALFLSSGKNPMFLSDISSANEPPAPNNTKGPKNSSLFIPTKTSACPTISFCICIETFSFIEDSRSSFLKESSFQALLNVFSSIIPVITPPTFFLCRSLGVESFKTTG